MQETPHAPSHRRLQLGRPLDAAEREPRRRLPPRPRDGAVDADDRLGRPDDRPVSARRRPRSARHRVLGGPDVPRGGRRDLRLRPRVPAGRLDQEPVPAPLPRDQHRRREALPRLGRLRHDPRIRHRRGAVLGRLLHPLLTPPPQAAAQEPGGVPVPSAPHADRVRPQRRRTAPRRATRPIPASRGGRTAPCTSPAAAWGTSTRSATGGCAASPGSRSSRTTPTRSAAGS